MRKSIVRQIRCGLFDGQVFISIRGAHTELPLQLARKYDFLLGLRICSTPTTATTIEKWKLYFRFGIICMVDHHTLLTLCDRSIRLPAYIYIYVMLMHVIFCDLLRIAQLNATRHGLTVSIFSPADHCDLCDQFHLFTVHC